MNILHINTYDSGGASKSAQRLHEGLLAQGTQSSVLFLSRKNLAIKCAHTFSTPPSMMNRLSFKLRTALAVSRSAHNYLHANERNYELFSLPFSVHDLTRHPLVQSADVINLHWVAGFVDVPSFFSKIRIPVVWTLHDMNPFSGGFHYADDAVRNAVGVGRLEANLIDQKMRFMSRARQVSVISPSRWLMQASQQSPVLGRFAHHHIPYGINTDIFSPRDKGVSRQMFGLSPDVSVLLFVSDSLTNPRKGGDLLMQAVERLGADKKWVVCVVGATDPNASLPANTVSVGRILDETRMSHLYSAADAVIIPSREDNLPNVMLEAMACGTPVVSFPIGGMAEVIQPGVNGLLSRDTTPASLAWCLKSVVNRESQFDRARIRQDAVAAFGLQVQAQNYLRLYTQILGASALADR